MKFPVSGHESYTLGLLGALHHLAISEDEWISANGLVERLTCVTGLDAGRIRVGVIAGVSSNFIERRTPSKSPDESK